MKYQFSELTDLELKIDFSIGHDVGEFKKGVTKRELFVIYEGPPVAENKDEFFDELKNWIGESK